MHSDQESKVKEEEEIVMEEGVDEATRQLVDEKNFNLRKRKKN